MCTQNPISGQRKMISTVCNCLTDKQCLNNAANWLSKKSNTNFSRKWVPKDTSLAIMKKYWNNQKTQQLASKQKMKMGIIKVGVYHSFLKKLLELRNKKKNNKKDTFLHISLSKKHA